MDNKVRSTIGSGASTSGQITYDVETGGAIEIRSCPLVVGVLGDFHRHPEQPLPKLKERRFVESDARQLRFPSSKA